MAIGLPEETGRQTFRFPLRQAPRDGFADKPPNLDRVADGGLLVLDGAAAFGVSADNAPAAVRTLAADGASSTAVRTATSDGASSTDGPATAAADDNSDGDGAARVCGPARRRRPGAPHRQAARPHPEGPRDAAQPARPALRDRR
ncbi:hypothetical protein ACFCWD_36870 [Streptomyces sp. NPDC056374]|uniref:hypothetical protein n=1 Tax=unclassified Streptomyces TaxID=2593676 RepID=UPI0035DB805C